MAKVLVELDKDERYPDWCWKQVPAGYKPIYAVAEVDEEQVQRWQAVLVAYEAMQDEIEALWVTANE